MFLICRVKNDWARPIEQQPFCIKNQRKPVGRDRRLNQKHVEEQREGETDYMAFHEDPQPFLEA